MAPVPDESTTKEDVKSKNYPDAIDINNFPASNDDFFGREKYFDVLDKAWDDEQVNILSFIAFGGIGKTSLIDNWLKRMKKNHYRGAKNIFMWSFYSQGSGEDRQISAIEFLNEACKFFRVKNFLKKDSYAQGRELADIISNQRTLLILDGLEPLQSSLENIGEVKDNGLQVLLKRLSRQNKGLVIITSRIKLAFIDNQYEELEKLEDSEGAELLDSFELNGTKKELEQISNNFDGHALALKLLGSYTKVVLDGDINRIDEIESLMNDKSNASKHATKMLNSYKKYLQREGKIELDILKLVGFFDRAISIEVINVLKNKPLIENINDNLIEVSERDWKYALDNLKKLHLISSNEKILDTHPLVREYFSKYIFDEYKDSYIKGHYRLYKYYEELPEKELPDTIEEMEPLFQAIYHGCKALKYDEVHYNIYFKRINRESMIYLVNNLSSNDKVLQVLANFYKIKYSEFHKGLSEKLKIEITAHVAYALHTHGKVSQSLNLFCLDTNSYNLFLPSDSLVRNVTNIIDSYCILCDFSKIDIYYNKYSQYLTQCNDPEMEAIFLASYAYAHFLKGDIENAKEIFIKTENIILKNSTFTKNLLLSQRKNPIEIEKMIVKNIYSTMAYMYFELLFYIKDYGEIQKRIRNVLNFSIYANWPLDIGLCYIVLGKLKFLNNEKEKHILENFNKGIMYLRKTKDLYFLCRGLTSRADMYISLGILDKANDDLDEVYDILIRSDLKKNFADWYIVAIKLELNNDIEKANTYFLEAKKLSKEIDQYFIFKEELKKLEPNFNKVI